MPNAISSLIMSIPGGGSGFGASISQRFAAEGCRVVIADLNEASAQATASTINLSDYTLVHKMDVSSQEDWTSVVKACVEKWGRLDITVNNAGTSYRNKVCITSKSDRVPPVKLIHHPANTRSHSRRIPTRLRRQREEHILVRASRDPADAETRHRRRYRQHLQHREPAPAARTGVVQQLESRRIEREWSIVSCFWYLVYIHARSTLTLHAPGNKRSGSRIRPLPDSRQRDLPVAVRHWIVRDVRGYAVHGGECEAVFRAGAAGATDGADGRGERGAVPSE